MLNLKEILAEKIHSLLSRQKSRDLYDLFFLLRFVEVERKIVERKLAIFNIDFDYKKLEHKIISLKTLWEKELKSFILTDLPDFNIVKNFVLKKLKEIF